MSNVTIHHDGPNRSPGGGRHVCCGLAGLGMVVALYLLWYPAIVGTSQGLLGVLSSTTIVWSFIMTWLLFWVGMDLALLGWKRRTTG